MRYYQQGDILVKSVDEIPAEGQLIKGRIVLAEGEVTGHAHVITGKSVLAYVVAGQMYIDVSAPTEIKHEEHGPIVIQPGKYRVDHVREYDHFEEEARYVAD